MKQPCVYMVTNYTKTVLYTGVTSDLIKRIWQHKEGLIDGFSKRYQCKHLMYYELCEEMPVAIEREKTIKGWRREKKERLINDMNPQWDDLYDHLV